MCAQRSASTTPSLSPRVTPEDPLSKLATNDAGRARAVHTNDASCSSQSRADVDADADADADAEADSATSRSRSRPQGARTDTEHTTRHAQLEKTNPQDTQGGGRQAHEPSVRPLLPSVHACAQTATLVHDTIGTAHIEQAYVPYEQENVPTRTSPAAAHGTGKCAGMTSEALSDATPSNRVQPPGQAGDSEPTAAIHSATCDAVMTRPGLTRATRTHCSGLETLLAAAASPMANQDTNTSLVHSRDAKPKPDWQRERRGRLACDTARTPRDHRTDDGGSDRPWQEDVQVWRPAGRCAFPPYAVSPSGTRHSSATGPRADANGHASAAASSSATDPPPSAPDAPLKLKRVYQAPEQYAERPAADHSAKRQCTGVNDARACVQTGHPGASGTGRESVASAPNVSDGHDTKLISFSNQKVLTPSWQNVPSVVVAHSGLANTASDAPAHHPECEEATSVHDPRQNQSGECSPHRVQNAVYSLQERQHATPTQQLPAPNTPSRASSHAEAAPIVLHQSAHSDTAASDVHAVGVNAVVLPGSHRPHGDRHMDYDPADPSPRSSTAAAALPERRGSSGHLHTPPLSHQQPWARTDAGHSSTWQHQTFPAGEGQLCETMSGALATSAHAPQASVAQKYHAAGPGAATRDRPSHHHDSVVAVRSGGNGGQTAASDCMYRSLPVGSDAQTRVSAAHGTRLLGQTVEHRTRESTNAQLRPQCAETSAVPQCDASVDVTYPHMALGTAHAGTHQQQRAEFHPAGDAERQRVAATIPVECKPGDTVTSPQAWIPAQRCESYAESASVAVAGSRQPAPQLHHQVAGAAAHMASQRTPRNAHHVHTVVAPPPQVHARQPHWTATSPTTAEGVVIPPGSNRFHASALDAASHSDPLAGQGGRAGFETHNVVQPPRYETKTEIAYHSENYVRQTLTSAEVPVRRLDAPPPPPASFPTTRGSAPVNATHPVGARAGMLPANVSVTSAAPAPTPAGGYFPQKYVQPSAPEMLPPTDTGTRAVPDLRHLTRRQQQEYAEVHKRLELIRGFELSKLEMSANLSNKVKMNLRGRARLELWLARAQPLTKRAVRIISQIFHMDPHITSASPEERSNAMLNMTNEMLRVCDALMKRINTKDGRYKWSLWFRLSDHLRKLEDTSYSPCAPAKSCAALEHEAKDQSAAAW